MNGPRPQRIAVTGKGGSGKTTISAMMTRILASAGGRRLLSIDADSAIGLPYALGVEPGRTVSEIRRRIIEEPRARDELDAGSIAEAMGGLLHEGEGFHLLVMGRPEGPGCYCAVNDLLRYGIESLSRRFDVVLIDCEAGPEQVNRRVTRGVDDLLIVTDATVRGLRAASSILEVALRDGSLAPGRASLVVNRSRGRDEPLVHRAAEMGFELLGCLPEDGNVTRLDSLGRPLSDLPPDTPCLSALAEIVEGLVR